MGTISNILIDLKQSDDILDTPTQPDAHQFNIIKWCMHKYLGYSGRVWEMIIRTPGSRVLRLHPAGANH